MGFYFLANGVSLSTCSAHFYFKQALIAKTNNKTFCTTVRGLCC
jgi:hypothetical protein